MTFAATERRLCRRLRELAEHGIASALVRPGINASVVDVSADGALIETRQRLLPGSSIEIYFGPDRRLPLVKATVLRCAVARLDPDRVSYRGAIVFDRRLPWFLDDRGFGYSVPNAERQRVAHKRAVPTRAAN
jgi:hypothetical protein